MNTDQHMVHHKYHKVTYTAVLLGLILMSAGFYNQFYLTDPMYHPMGGYVLLVPGVLIILRALHPPIGFIRVLTTLMGGLCLGMSPMFLDINATETPWIGFGLILCGVALLGGSFTMPIKVHKQH